MKKILLATGFLIVGISLAAFGRSVLNANPGAAAVITETATYTLPRTGFVATLREAIAGGEDVASRAEKKIPAPPTPPPPPPADETPVRLAIPALKIETNVQRVGLTASGDMGTPSGRRIYRDVAWYKGGAAPGEPGTVVFAGHLDNSLALPAVFYHLDDLAIGDFIIITNYAGEDFSYVVREVAHYSHDAVPLARIFRTEGKEELVLITCGGDWIRDEKTYGKRVAVYAERIISAGSI